MPGILVIEDDPGIREVLEHALARAGFEPEAVGSGEAALERFHSGGYYELVILDLMLPGMDGIEVCRVLRAESDVPIIMLTARKQDAIVVAGLEVGADDYVTKPFNPQVLVSRVRANLRRQRLNSGQAHPERRASEERRLVFPGLEIDVPRRKVVAGGEPAKLTAREFEVLVLLAAHPGRVYSPEQIMSHLWGGEFFGEPRTAAVHVGHVRRKIEPNPKEPRYIETVYGVGYRFAEL